MVRTGSPTNFETSFPPLEKHFRISVFSPTKSTFATVFQDITRRKTLEEEQKEREDRFRLAVEGAQLGLWDWDVKNDVVTVSDFLAMIFPDSISSGAWHFLAISITGVKSFAPRPVCPRCALRLCS